MVGCPVFDRLVMVSSVLNADEAWRALVSAAVEWSKHMDQWERFKFETEFSPVYVSMDLSVQHPDSFDLVDAGGQIVRQAGA